MDIQKYAAGFSRHLYWLPGGYFLVQLLKGIFFKPKGEQDWKNFSFRGIQMRVDVSKQMGAAIYWRGAHDWAPIFSMEKAIKAGDTVLDIGANQGEYALWAARKTGSSGKVYAFEPLGIMFSQLEYNISLNPRFKNVLFPIRLGLSDKEGRLDLFSGNLSNEGVNTLFPDPDSTFLETIQLKTMDDVVNSLPIEKINCIKIDVEGAELQVLKGGMATISKYRPYLFLEINQEACKKAGYEAQAIFDLLKPLGYRFKKIGLRGKLKSLDFDNLPAFCNILAQVNR
jgi:FkbM family methyltransferase